MSNRTRSLIVGITGCAGSHLAELLLDEGHRVFGTKRASSSPDNIRHLSRRICLVDVSLDDGVSIRHALATSRPHFVYFLAAARHSADPEDLFRTDVEGTSRFFDALSSCSFKSRVVLVSSSAVYGEQTKRGAIREDAALLPITRHGVAKLCQEQVGRYFCRRHGIDVVIARPFNYSGPREREGLLCTDLAMQIASIEMKGRGTVMKVGNLEARRDISDVRDIVRGYAVLAERGRSGEAYNLCAGRSWPVSEVLRTLLSLSAARITVRVSRNLFRGEDIKGQAGSYAKVAREAGWRPIIPLHGTLRDVLAYCRERRSHGLDWKEGSRDGCRRVHRKPSG